MKTKRPQLIIAFYTTADAMATESVCRQQNLAGRLIPVPREISAGCGIAWAAPAEEEEALMKALSEAGIEPQEAKVLLR